VANIFKSSKVKFAEIKEKILVGSRIAFEELVKRKQKENGFLIVTENGKVIQKPSLHKKLSCRFYFTIKINYRIGNSIVCLAFTLIELAIGRRNFFFNIGGRIT
jgi:hypothetical protein